MVVVDKEVGAATDNLNTINGGKIGAAITIRSANSGRDPTLVRTVSGEGEIIPGAANVTLTSIYDQITLRKNAEGVWTAISDINNG